MNAPALGYVILYVNDVATSLAFNEKAFGLARRVFHDDNGKVYGKLETGAKRLAFASVALATEHLKQPVVEAAPDKSPMGVKISKRSKPHSYFFGKFGSAFTSSICLV